MMKRMLCVLLTLLLCAASAQADAVLDTVDYDNAAEISTKSQDGLYLYVVLEDGTAGITGYLGDETALVIPSVVDDLPVTAIGAYAFEYAALTSVVIPEGVTVCGGIGAEGNHAAIHPAGNRGGGIHRLRAGKGDAVGGRGNAGRKSLCRLLEFENHHPAEHVAPHGLRGVCGLR